MKWSGVCYRSHEPQYASEPTSGTGAIRAGGRFNPPGTAALYLACSIEDMIGETMHSLPHLDPATICSYDVDVDEVVDLSTDAARGAEGVRLSDMACGWILDAKAGKQPASWVIAMSLIERRCQGHLGSIFCCNRETSLAKSRAVRLGDPAPIGEGARSEKQAPT